MSARTLAGCGALVLALAAPAAAQGAPAIAPLEPCYATVGTPSDYDSDPVEISATGFTPNSQVDLTIDGSPVDGGSGLQTDAAGNLPLPPIKAPFVSRGIRGFTVTLTERGNPANTVSATAKSTALGVSLSDHHAEVSQRVRFSGLGFIEPKPIYAHYVRKGRLRETVRMARRPGECGGFSVRRREFPFPRPKQGLWVIKFDQHRRFIRPSQRPIRFARILIRVTLERR